MPKPPAPSECPVGRTPGHSGARRVGAGRSGEVWERHDSLDRRIAAKVFGSSGLTRLVQIVLLGAPNPYAWCEDAVRCAVLRRRILVPLVSGWFGDRLRVANALGHAWNPTSRSWELHAEWVDGRPPALHHPLNREAPRRDEARTLQNRLLPLLQERLLDAGLDGLVWQAGLGNPVALNNFLREAGGTWVWIDLESGVPALIPANPLSLLRTYLPLSWKHRAALFDDVDTKRLASWIDRNEASVVAASGPEKLRRLKGDVAELARLQALWKGRGRLRSSLEAAVASGSIGTAEASWYAKRPVRWYARMAAGALQAIPPSIVRAARSVVVRLRKIRPTAMAWHAGRFVVSHGHRVKVARVTIGRRLVAWRRRGQLTASEVREMRHHLEQEAITAHLGDFAVHLGLNAVSKCVEASLLPVLLVQGMIGAVTFGVLLVALGATFRTAYTAGRITKAFATGSERPWVALVVGFVPTFGNLAFPAQIFYRAERGSEPAQFLIYDTFARCGSHLPIWGGRDTATEHMFNRLAEKLLLRPIARVAPDRAGG